jgi:hypothetical protein
MVDGDGDEAHAIKIVGGVERDLAVWLCATKRRCCRCRLVGTVVVEDPFLDDV